MGSNVSRRNFIRIVTDALITLPPAATLLPAAALPAAATVAASPTEALAATGDDVGILGVRGPVAEDGVLWTNEVKLIPLNTSEVAFHVVDMANKNPETSFVPGAHVKVTSRDNGKSVEGYTNENGDVLFNIATLAENPDNLPIDKLEKYFFFGTVEVTCEGYRDFLTGRMIVEGMETHVVPTRKLEDDMPYPAKVTFDAWDILYSDNTPMYNATNTTKHALEVLIKNVGDESITIALCERESKQVVRSFEDFPIDGAISGAFHYEFLHKGSNEAISPETSYCITITREDGTAYEFPIALWAEESAFSEPKTVPKTDNLAPLGVKPGFQAGLSKIIPIGGGDTFKSWLPTFGPFEVSFDPGGSASVSLLIGKEDWNCWGKSKEWAQRPDGSMGYEETERGAKPSSKDGWQWFPKKSIDDQWAKKKQDIQDSYKSFKAAQAVRKGAEKKDIMYSHGFHMGVKLTAQGIFTWEGLKYTGSSLFEKGSGGLAWNAKNSAKFSGALGIAILASADYEFCRNFFWGPVPMLFQFGINLKVNASALGGMVIDDPDTDRLEKVKRGEPVTDKWDIVTNFDNWNYDFTNTGFNLTVTFSPYISLGVGIKGVASASVRGSVLLTVYMGIPTRRKSLHDGQPDISDTNAYPAPHWIFSYQAEISVQLQLFFFSYAISVAKGKKTNAYNNWPCKENGFKPGGGWADGPFLEAAADDEVAFDSYANRDLASLMNEMQPMDGNFSRMVEGSWTPSLTAQAEEEPPTVYCKYQENAMVADDGTQIPCTMYSYFPLEEAQSAQDVSAQDLSELEKQVEEAKAAAEQKAKDAEEAQTKADEARAQAADAQSREDEASLLNADSAAAEAAAAEAAQAAAGGVPAAGAPLEAVGVAAQAEVEPPEATEASSAEAVPVPDASGLAEQAEALEAEAEKLAREAEEAQKKADELAEQLAKARTEAGSQGQATDQAGGQGQAEAAGQADGAQPAGQPQAGDQADGGHRAGQAQPDGQPQAGLTAASAPREFEAPDYTMDWEPQFGGIGAMADAASDPVVGIGSDGGVILNAATNDRRWNPEGTSVLGSVRMQTVTINGVTYTLRVGVVSVKGSLRTRVIATVIDGALGGHGVGEVQALDFHFVAAGGERDMHWEEIPKRVRDNREYIRQHTHDNFFDYDFAVAGDSEQGCLILSVISGKRDLTGASNAENLANVSTGLVFTTVVFRQSRAASDKGLFSTYLQPLSWGGNFLLDVSGAKKYHCLSNLQITMQLENRDNSKSATAVIAFLDRSGDQPQDCINDKNALVRLGIMLYSYIPFNGDSIRSLYTDVDASAIEKLVNNSGCPLNDLSAYELVFWPRTSGSNSSTFVVRGANKANYYSMVFDTKYYEFGGGIGLYRPEIKAIKWHGAYDANTRLHMWREEDGNPVFLGTEAVSDQFAVTAQQDAALTAMAETADNSSAVVDAYKRRLCSARVGDSSLQFSKIGPDDFGISSFGVCGDFIYWPGTKDGVTGHTFDEASSELAENEPENKKYIMGARFRMGSFGNPFYLADLPHAADQMVSLDGTGEALTVVTCGVKNLETNTADLHVVRIPFVRAVNAIRAFVSTPYVVPGKQATFYIAIRNDGNTYIGGCEVEMYEGSDKTKKLDSTSIAFDATTTQASEFNGEKEDGTLEDVEPDFALAPGKTSVYAVGFTIPESWKGGEDANGNRITKSVSFRALHPTTKSATGGNAVVAQADDEEGVEYHVADPTTVMDAIEIDVEVYAPDYMSQTDAPVTPYTPGVSDGDGKGTGAGTGAGAGANQGTGGGVGSTANAGASRATLPNTADHNSLGTAGALGVAAAAVLAYERRRARNER